MADDDLMKEARQAFQYAAEAENHNRDTYLEDVRFARGGEQWPDDIRAQREREERPILTINKLPAFIRQVVNDARQNKPAIKVLPVDSGADKETAEVINGLIRNIENTSNADVAYDTATECAVTGGFGYIRVGIDFAHDDAFDMDITIQRVSNPLSVYGDPYSTAADSSDWNEAFVVDRLTKDAFKKQYGDKATVDWDDDDAWRSLKGTAWRDETTVMVAEWWKREEVDREIVLLSNGMTVAVDELEKDPDLQALMDAGVVQVLKRRKTKRLKVTQRIMSGVEVLETNEWPGKYIPIVPVYGDEFDIEGRRYFRSLIHNAIDAQRMFNYWRTTSTELVALAPKVPFIGEEGAFDPDIERWNTANTKSHAFLEFSKGMMPPQRQPLDSGVAGGAIQEALNASDDMKSIIGIYDASLGARSNETSGRAIMARQREGDISTFHFMDNMARAIRHVGRIIIDLIPKIYDAPRIVRVLGEDGSEEAVPVNQQAPAIDPKTGEPQRDERGEAIMRMHDLTAGKYDLTVTTGPSFTTRREEAAYSMTEALRAFPDGAPVIVPELAKNLDWPGADEIAEKLEALMGGGVPPQVQAKIEEGMQRIQQLEEENAQLKADRTLDEAELEAEIIREEKKAQAQERIEQIKIASQERIAQMKIQSEAGLSAYKARLQAEASVQAAAMRPAPQPSRGA